MNSDHESIISMNICNSNEEHFELRKGPFTLEEDNLLIQYIGACGEGRWNALAKCAGLKRAGKSCRLRWLNYLKPDPKRVNLTPQEQLMILELHSKWGNRYGEECLSEEAMKSSEMGCVEMCFSDHITHSDSFNHDEGGTIWGTYDL